MNEMLNKHYREFGIKDLIFSKLTSPIKAIGFKNFIKACILLFIFLSNSVVLRIGLKNISEKLQKIKIRTLYKFYNKKIVCYNVNNLHYIFSPWEEHEFGIIKKFYKKGVAIDAGAYIGTHSLIMSEVADKVYAFEANPKNAKVLRENIEINNIKNVIVIEKVISSKKGTIKFNFSGEGDGTGKVSENGIEMESVSIDDIVKGKAGFVKMDVEGHEVEVIKGGEKTLKRSFPPIMFEALCKEKLEKVVKELEKIGYEKFYKINQFSYLAIKRD